MRDLVALGWMLAGELCYFGLARAQPEVQRPARLGHWGERPNHPPGKLVLRRGLRRPSDPKAFQRL